MKYPNSAVTTHRGNGMPKIEQMISIAMVKDVITSRLVRVAGIHDRTGYTVQQINSCTRNSVRRNLRP